MRCMLGQKHPLMPQFRSREQGLNKISYSLLAFNHALWQQRVHGTRLCENASSDDPTTPTSATRRLKATNETSCSHPSPRFGMANRAALGTPIHTNATADGHFPVEKTTAGIEAIHGWPPNFGHITEIIFPNRRQRHKSSGN